MEELSNSKTNLTLRGWLRMWNAGKTYALWRELERGAERMRMRANLLDWSVECEGRWLHAEVKCIMACGVIVPIRRRDRDRNETMEQLLQHVADFSAPNHFGQPVESVLDSMEDMQEKMEVVSQKLRVARTKLQRKRAAEVKRLRSEKDCVVSKNLALLDECMLLEAADVKMSQELGLVQQAATADRLRFEAEKTQIQVEATQEAHICLICMVNPRDVVILPCSHGVYCSKCLEKHRKRKRTCPLCNATITGSFLYRSS